MGGTAFRFFAPPNVDISSVLRFPPCEIAMSFSAIHYEGLEQRGFFMGIYCSVLEQFYVSKPDQCWGGLKTAPTEWDPPNSSAVTAELCSPEAWWLFFSSSARGVRRLKWQERCVPQGRLEMGLIWPLPGTCKQSAFLCQRSLIC